MTLILQIFFGKNVNQYHKLIRILTGWHRKQDRSDEDLREQVEPLFKGQKHLLEEFSRFFANDRPPER